MYNVPVLTQTYLGLLLIYLLKWTIFPIASYCTPCGNQMARTYEFETFKNETSQ